jgi:hypothetical protein
MIVVDIVRLSGGGRTARRCGRRPVSIVKLGRAALFSGPCPVRILGASSVKVVPPTKWSRFSMVHYQRTIFTSRCRDAWRLVRSATT